MKYKKRSENIFTDYRYYIEKEGMYNIFYGHKLEPKQTAKANYIWKRLLKVHEKELLHNGTSSQFRNTIH